MTHLEKHVFHDCEKPDIPDVLADYRWTCPECETEWMYWRGYQQPGYLQTYGFLGLNSRYVTGTLVPGSWSVKNRTSSWQSVEETPTKTPTKKTVPTKKVPAKRVRKKVT